MKYFAYARKSSEESNRQAQSLETQKRILLDYAKDNNLEIVSVIEENKSAKDEDNRERFEVNPKKCTQMLYHIDMTKEATKWEIKEPFHQVLSYASAKILIRD